MGALAEGVLAPRADEPAVALVDEDRSLAAREEVDPVLGVDGDRGNILVTAAGR